MANQQHSSGVSGGSNGSVRVNGFGNGLNVGSGVHVRGENGFERVLLPDLFSIQLRVDERWEDPNHPEVTYEGGILRYIHHINPDDFSLARLMSFGYVAPIQRALNLFWYRAPNLPYEESIVCLENEEDVAKMFKTADDAGESMVDVLMQDTDLEWGDKGEMVLYVLPPMIAHMSEAFNWMGNHMAAVRILEEEDELGEKMFELMELTGERPYMTQDPYPLGVFRNCTQARMSGFRDFSRD